MERVGVYVRVSTKDQDASMQVKDLLKDAKRRGWKVVDVYEDQESGAKNDRPNLDRLLSDARQHKIDHILCWKFDRIARSTLHLLTILEECQHIGISFTSLKDQIDMSGPYGKAMFTIAAAFAELERSLLIDRQEAGIAYAKEHGTKSQRAFAAGKDVTPRYFGREPLSEAKQEEIRRKREAGDSYRTIAKAVGVSLGAVQNYAKDIKVKFTAENRSGHPSLDDEKVKKIEDFLRADISAKDTSAQTGIPLSTVQKYRRLYKKRGGRRRKKRLSRHEILEEAKRQRQAQKAGLSIVEEA
jgi:DNA invertase Pin-like site-specific DNA recombinase